MKFFFTFLFYFFYNYIFSQNFEILKEDISKIEYNSYIDSLYNLKKNDFIYENEKYIVSKICKGEWGGAIIFKNKLTEENFICKSTCPVSIVEFNNKYILTSSLSHLGDSTQIIEIQNPEKTSKLNLQNFDENYQNLSQIGSKKLLDVYGFITLGTFIYNNKLFHIISEKNGTYIAEIKSNKFRKIQKIYNERLWSIARNIFFDEQNLIIPFSDPLNSGYLKVNENKINLYILNK